ncbi:VOC family protein [Corallococcus sp. AB018]|uniref:VOC family protein n=1 Tax=Corallococcus TaxID=83461 RepID=UPI000EA3CB66|nr:MULTISPECIES: VOC family protein [unclassified Corallococcus]RKH25712.1 VOC family protein [Corallococcus sp. CA041A]RUO92377.1 VOC family protein [Corallococcus sp. AB018]
MSTGSFIWYELMTHDPDAAAKFYGAVVGWKITAPSESMPSGQDYRMIMRGDGGSAGGVLRLSQDMVQHGAQPCWLGYLHVADVDASIQAMVADGARVLMPRMDLPVGKIAMVADPMGTPFYVMAPIPPPGKPDAKSDVFDVKASQRIRWNELASPDLTRAKTFYAKHFHFQFNEVMPMGPMGDYCFVDHDGVRLGAIMQKPAENPGPTGTWLFYFGVPSVAEAQRAITANGGKVLQGPHEVPGGDWIVVATDPSGAAFGVVGSKGE